MICKNINDSDDTFYCLYGNWEIFLRNAFSKWEYAVLKIYTKQYLTIISLARLSALYDESE